MAIEKADQSDAGEFSDGEASDPASEDHRSRESDPDAGPGARVGEYTWEDFMDEYGYGDEVSVLYPGDPASSGGDRLGLDTGESSWVPSGDDWDQVEFDPESYLGHHPDDLRSGVLARAGDNADALQEIFLDYVDPETTPVVKDVWTWEHYKWEYYYEEDGSRPRDGDGEIVRHDREEALGFDPDTVEQRLFAGDEVAMELDELVDERTVDVQDDFDEDEFFSTAAGNTTVSNRYDLEKSVPLEKKSHFREVERYWVNKPYAYVVIFHSEKENEKKYYMIEPHLNEIELELQEFLSGKLRTAIKYSDEGVKEKASEDGRRTVIEEETRKLLKRYDLFEKSSGSTQENILETVRSMLDDEDDGPESDDEVDLEGIDETEVGPDPLEGLSVRPEPAILEDDPDTLNEYQVEKLLYQLKRNFIGYERIDGIKHDINVEDISCDGYNSPVFVYHSEYEQIISNIYHGDDELDDFVVKLAQRSGKGISKRLPQVDATLPDGSRAQLTLGQEVSDHGTNYTIRQFKDVPFTPIDLINWNTFSLDEMAFLWLCIENHKSLIFAGGTASGKTTSLNAVSLFIPSSAKIVSIEDTREVELPQRNWIASVTRPSFADDEQGDVDEFDLLEAALRQRPDYIVMGEIRGEEGRTLFQVMSTGHTTYTTFHADSVDEVLKRFTTDPINVSKTMFTALDLVSIQTQTRVQGHKVRRNKSLTEINHYEAEHDEINVQDVYQWQAETDEYLKMGDSNTLEEIQFDRGWTREKLEDELFKREAILAYLIKNGLNTYAEVAATVQAFINDNDTILTLIANGQLEDSLEDLREMESVLIDVDQEKEELVPRPSASDETYNLSTDILERAEESLFDEYRGQVPSGLANALGEIEPEDSIEVDTSDAEEFDFPGGDGLTDEQEWEVEDGATDFASESGEPAWVSEDDGATAEADGQVADMPTDDRTADATSSAAGGVEGTDAGPESAGAASSPGGEGDTTVLPSDDPEDDDLGGLFNDMGETIDELADAERAAESTSGRAETDPGLDSMFQEDDLESIFDPESDDGAGEDADESGAGDGDDRPATGTGGDERPSTEDEPTPVDPATSDGDGPTEVDVDEIEESEVPTIDVGEPTDDDPGDDTSPDEPGTPPQESGTGDADGAASTTDEPTATSNTDSSSDDEADSSSDDEADSSSNDEAESIFGSGSNPIFSDEDDDVPDEDGSLFDTDETEGESSDSIFGRDDERNEDGPVGDDNEGAGS